jgi:hypothetical protein
MCLLMPVNAHYKAVETTLGFVFSSRPEFDGIWGQGAYRRVVQEMLLPEGEMAVIAGSFSHLAWEVVGRSGR